MAAPAIYSYTIPTYINGLNALTAILKKAEAHANEHNIPLSDLFNARLYDDMKPLPFQVFAATTTASKALARQTLVEPGDYEQSDTSFADFYARIDRTVAELKAADPASFAGKEDTAFTAPMGPVKLDFTPSTYARSFAVPNFFFHVNAAYAVLRAKGVPLGKMDYLGSFASA